MSHDLHVMVHLEAYVSGVTSDNINKNGLIIQYRSIYKGKYFKSVTINILFGKFQRYISYGVTKHAIGFHVLI